MEVKFGDLKKYKLLKSCTANSMYYNLIKESTPLYMIYAELGRFLFEINRLCPKNTSSLNLAFNIYFYENGSREYKWINYFENILQDVGRCDLWIYETIANPNTTQYVILHTLKDQYIQNDTYAKFFYGKVIQRI